MSSKSNEERAPLLQEDHSELPQNQAAQYSNVNCTSGGYNTPYSSGTDEPPPRYTPGPGIPMVDCRVCQVMINIEGKLNQHVVKCPECNEATPIKQAPAGKKYVRCPCNCLLICKSTSQRIACPRHNCKRVINLTPQNLVGGTAAPGSERVVCGHCQDVFLFHIQNNALARCPHCRKISSVGPSFARNRAMFFGILGFLFLCAGIGVTVGTYEIAGKGYFVLWIGAFVIGILNLARAVYYLLMRTSTVVGGAA